MRAYMPICAVALLVNVFCVRWVQGETLYVDDDSTCTLDCGGDWCNAYGTLHEALGDAGANTTIRVADGRYTPDWLGSAEPREATFRLQNNVTLEGGYAGCSESSPDERDVESYETILSGDRYGDDDGDLNDSSRDENAYHVVTVSGSGVTHILDGFTITGGNADGDDSSYRKGGGMYNGNDRVASVSNCTFIGNSAFDDGGGMYNYMGSLAVTHCRFSGNSANHGAGMYNNSAGEASVSDCTFSENSAFRGGGMYNRASVPSVSNCTFSGNSANSGAGMGNYYNSDAAVTNCTFSGNSAVIEGGGMDNSNSDPTVTNCTVSGNSANDYGGGMYNSYANPSVTNCSFSENSAIYGAGMYNTVDSDAAVTNCTFNGNTANDGGGAMFNINSDAHVTNCTFSGNTANYSGGGMYNSGNSNVDVTNCTFSGNTANYSGGAMYNSGATATVISCILWGDTPDEIPNGTPSLTISFSDLQGGLPIDAIDGGDNIATDPLFADAYGADGIAGTADDNLRLRLHSLCIDTGDPTFLPDGGDTDLDGSVRVIDGDADEVARVDMGAYEFHQIYVDGGPDAQDGAGDGSSWCNAYLTLHEPLGVALSGDTILVAGGTYKPDTTGPDYSRGETFQLVKGMTIEGGYAGCGYPDDPNYRNFDLHESILSGDLNGDDLPGFTNYGDNSYHVITADAVTQVVLEGLTIERGNANVTGLAENGGGILITDDSSVTIEGCTFRLNSGVKGGAIYSENSNLTLRSLDPPGACTIEWNQAADGGGIYTDQSDLTLSGCVLASNYSAQNGGGMYSNSSPDTTLTACQYRWNFAGGNGGGIYETGSSSEVVDCLFRGNSAANGGGMYSDNPVALEIGDFDAPTGFDSNIAFDGDGGGLYVAGREPHLDSLQFADNLATGAGGGLFVDSGDPHLEGCRFERNSAGSDGGAIATGNGDSGSPFLEDCWFVGNDAANGGGVQLGSGEPTLLDCRFHGNVANGGNGEGGALHIGGVSSPLLVNCAFSGNDAYRGGGIALTGTGGLTITNCALAGNNANYSTGGMYMSGSPGVVRVTNTILSNNTLRNETDPPDPPLQIYPQDESAIVNFSCIEGGWDGAGGVGNILTDPRFVDLDDLRLTAGSPCIDVGNNYAVPPDVTADLDGNDRLFDNPCADDGGKGEAPIVDIGPYEFVSDDLPWKDCNNNDIHDYCDIAYVTSDDCNENDIPDECEIDRSSTAPDGPFYCDPAAPPVGLNECGLDCNNNGILDECDLATCFDSPECEDCNENGVPDESDIESVTSDDCNDNRVPDECDIAAGTSEDCDENGTPDQCDLATCLDSPECEDCNENGVLDKCDIAVGPSEDCLLDGVPDECEIDRSSTAPDGPFYCDPGAPPVGLDECDPDCNDTGIPDECEADCQSNGVPDDCEIMAGTSEDCNGDGIPDECDIGDETPPDCNENAIPDECDITEGTSADCNANDIPDECDIGNGTSLDCNGNFVPDECELQWNDCQPDGVLDDCGITADCNGNDIPDECEPDCDESGVPDACDIADCDADPDCADSNGNGIPDGCEPMDAPGSLLAADGREVGLDVIDLSTLEGGFAGTISGMLDGSVIGGVAYDWDTEFAYVAATDADERIGVYLVDLSTRYAAALGRYPETAGTATALTLDPTFVRDPANTSEKVLYLAYAGADGARVEIIELVHILGDPFAAGSGAVLEDEDYVLGSGAVEATGLAYHRAADKLYATGSDGSLYQVDINQFREEASLELVLAMGQVLENLAYDPARNRLVAIGDSEGDGRGRLHEITFAVEGANITCDSAGFSRSAEPLGLAYWDAAVPLPEVSPWEELPPGSARGAGISKSCENAVEPSIAIDTDTGGPVIAWADGTVIRVEEYVPESGDDLAPWTAFPPPDGEPGAHTPSIDVIPCGDNACPIVAWSQVSILGSREIFVKWYNEGEGTWAEKGVDSGLLFGISGTLANSTNPALVVDGAGLPIVAWDEHDDDFDVHQVYVRRWEDDADSGDWVEMSGGSASGGGVSDSAHRAEDVALAVDAFGQPILAWANKDTNTEAFEIFVVYWDGFAWLPLGQGAASGTGVSGSSETQDRYPSLAVDETGDVYVAWSACMEANCSCSAGSAPDCSQVKVKRWDGSNWEPLGESAQPAGISDTPGSSVHPSVVVNTGGNVAVAWLDKSVEDHALILVRAWDVGAQLWLEVGPGSAVGGSVSATSFSEDAGPPALAVAKTGPVVTWQHDSDEGVSQVFVRQFAGSFGITVVGEPEAVFPAPGQTDVNSDLDVETNFTIPFRWRPGTNSDWCDLFFGTDPDALAKVNTEELIVIAEEESLTYSYVIVPQVDGLYYWRVDCFASEPASIPFIGTAWSFHTGFVTTHDVVFGAELAEDVSPIRGVPGLELQGYQNLGEEPTLAVGQEGATGQIRRALMKWDLCVFAYSLPGPMVTAASLQLELTSVESAVTLQVHRMRVPWIEGTGQWKPGNTAGEPDGASWNTFDGVEAWPGQVAANQLDGAGFTDESAVRGPDATLLGQVSVTGGETGQLVIELDVGQVQAWISGEAINHGFLIKASTTDEQSPDTLLEFESSEGATAPTLTISYFESGEDPRLPLAVTPAPFQATGATTGGGSITFQGDGFSQGMTVTFEGQDHRVTIPPELLDITNDTEFSAPIPPFPPGWDCASKSSFDVTITVSNGCDTIVVPGAGQDPSFIYTVATVNVAVGDDLQSVIRDAAPGTCIVLEEGVHDGPVSFLSNKSAITVTSATPTQPGLTKIDGESLGAPGSGIDPTVRFSGGGGDIAVDGVGDEAASAYVSGAPVVLRGLNIRLGNSGLLIERASPLIMDCRIDNNFAGPAYAGGVTIRNDAHPVLMNCAIEGNTVTGTGGRGGGIRVEADCSPTIAGCSIASNRIEEEEHNADTGFGGGIYLVDTPGTAVIAGNDIRGNRAEGDGGGVYWGGTAAGRFFLNVVEGNTAGGNGPGIFCSSDAQPSIDNNLIDGNGDFSDGNFGGGIFIDEFNTYPISIRENIIRNNTAQRGGAIYMMRKAGPQIIRNVIAGNEALQTYESADDCPENNDGPSDIPEAEDAYAPGIFAHDAEPDLIGNTVHGNAVDPMCVTGARPPDEQGGGFHGETLVTGDSDVFSNIFTVNSGFEMYADASTTSVEVEGNLFYECDKLKDTTCNDELITPAFVLFDEVENSLGEDPRYSDGTPPTGPPDDIIDPDPSDIAWPREPGYPGVLASEHDIGVHKFDGYVDYAGALADDGASYATVRVPPDPMTVATVISIEVHSEAIDCAYVGLQATEATVPSPQLTESYYVRYEFEDDLVSEVANADIEIPLRRSITPVPSNPVMLYRYESEADGYVAEGRVGEIDRLRQVVRFTGVSLVAGCPAAAAAGDADHDGDVDLRDVAVFATCFVGGGERDSPPLSSECSVCDLDEDGDVDLADYAELRFGFTPPR